MKDKDTKWANPEEKQTTRRGLLAATGAEGANLLAAFQAVSPSGCQEASQLTDILLGVLTGRYRLVVSIQHKDIRSLLQQDMLCIRIKAL
jgi:hypothetical protein